MRKEVTLILFSVFLYGCGKEVLYSSNEENTPIQVDSAVPNSIGSETGAEKTDLIKGGNWETNQIWSGTWSRSGHMEEALLIIENEENAHFDFSLTASSGANTGEISGQGTLLKDGMTAKYILQKKYNPEAHECIVTMDKFKQEITIDVSESCSLFLDTGVTLSGVYTYGEIVEEENKLGSLGLVDEEVDEALHLILGKDYRLLTDRMHLVSEGEDLDGLNTTVLHGGVRNLYTIRESIIMYDSQGHIWVALLIDDSIEYYTNAPQFKNSLPQTIIKWSERFDGKTININ